MVRYFKGTLLRKELLLLNPVCYNVQFQEISILPPQKRLEFPEGAGGSVRPKHLQKCLRPNWNFQRGGGSSVGEVWIFSGITYYLCG